MSPDDLPEPPEPLEPPYWHTPGEPEPQWVVTVDMRYYPSVYYYADEVSARQAYAIETADNAHNPECTVSLGRLLEHT